MFKSNKTPEERLLFWMKRAKRLEKRLAYEKREVSAANELFQSIKDEHRRKMEKYESATKAADKLKDDYISLSKLLSTVTKRRDELENKLKEINITESEEKTDFNSDNLSDYGELPPKMPDQIDLSKEITDLLLECNLYPSDK